MFLINVLIFFTLAQDLESTAQAPVEAKPAGKCELDFSANKCDDFKNSLAKEDQAKVIDCNKPESAAWIPVTCGKGVAMFAWHTVKGVLSLPSALKSGFQESAKCYEDKEKRRALLAPVVPFWTEEKINFFINNTGMTCADLSRQVQSYISYKFKEIGDRKKNARDYEQLLGQNPTEDQRRNAERLYPEKSRSPLTPEEQALVDGESERVKKMWESIGNSVKNKFNCFTSSAQAEITCEIIASIAAPGAAVKLLKSPKVAASIADIKKSAEAKFADVLKKKPVVPDQPAGVKVALVGREADIVGDLSSLTKKEAAEIKSVLDKAYDAKSGTYNGAVHERTARSKDFFHPDDFKLNEKGVLVDIKTGKPVPVTPADYALFDSVLAKLPKYKNMPQHERRLEVLKLLSECR